MVLLNFQMKLLGSKIVKPNCRRSRVSNQLAMFPAASHSGVKPSSPCKSLLSCCWARNLVASCMTMATCSCVPVPASNLYPFRFSLKLLVLIWLEVPTCMVIHLSNARCWLVENCTEAPNQTVPTWGLGGMSFRSFAPNADPLLKSWCLGSLHSASRIAFCIEASVLEHWMLWAPKSRVCLCVGTIIRASTSRIM